MTSGAWPAVGQVIEERICDDDHLIIKGGKTQRACCALLRGANMHMLDEVDRSLHDALCAVKRTLESASVVPGGGCVESALSIYLENFATTLGSREQLAIAEFAEALLVIPKTLAVNAAHDAIDLVSKLRSRHHAAQTDESKKEFAMYGLDLGSLAICLASRPLMSPKSAWSASGRTCARSPRAATCRAWFGTRSTRICWP